MILILILISICYTYFSLKEAGHEEIIIDYNVRVKSVNNTEFHIYLPKPNNINSFKLEDGDAEYKIVNTEYGEALELKSKDDTIISGNSENYGNEIWNHIDRDQYFLTLYNKNYWQFWIYSEYNDSLYFDLNYVEKLDNPYIIGSNHIHLNYSISQGWNLYNITSIKSPHGDKFGWHLEETKRNVKIVNIIIFILIIIIFITHLIKVKRKNRKSKLK